MSPTVTSRRDSSSLNEFSRSLRDGRKRLVGLIDGYSSYYDRRRHRIDVLLEDADGNEHLSEYYRLQPNETVREFVQQAEQSGYDCRVLARWSPHRHAHRPRSAVSQRLRRAVHGLYACLVRWARRTRENTDSRS